jgi:hypothetical protein
MYKTLSGQANGDAIVHRGCIENSFNIIADTRVCFIFDADVLENESTQTIVDNYLILQRYELSLDDIQQLEWVIPFPPTEKMKYMKMYPPYGTYNKKE